MAVLKCNICGGEVDFSADMSIGVCQYCDSTITIPKDLDHKGNLYNRAVFLRQNNEFDKAVLIYEDILKEDNTDAEAHWGLVLSKFGIEYVADPVTGEHIPTCHRTQPEPILTDPDYLAALEYYDAQSSSVIEAQAEQINKIQSKILEISRKEPPYDIFICYKETDESGGRTEDSIVAQELYYELLKRKYRVFFARKTLESKLGSEYEPIIYAALNSASVMIVVGTRAEYFNAVWVRNEWSRFMKMARTSDKKKVIIPAYKGISPYELPNELSNFQSQDMGKIGFMQDLTDGIERYLRNKEEKNDKKEEDKSETDSRQRLIKNGEVHIKLQNYSTAEGVYRNLVNDYPEDYRGWWGLILCETKSFTDYSADSDKVNTWYKYVRQLAAPEQIAQNEELYISYTKNLAQRAVEDEKENIRKIIYNHNNAIVNNQQRIEAIKSSSEKFKHDYQRQHKTDNENIEKAKKGLATNNRSLLRKAIFLGGFAVLLLVAVVLMYIGLESDPWFVVASLLVGLVSFVCLLISAGGSFKGILSQIKYYENHLDECYSCKDKNTKKYNEAIKEYDKNISLINEAITLLRMKIVACNNYLNIGDDAIAQFCFALKCAAFGMDVGMNPDTKELRDLAYGYKELVINKASESTFPQQTEEPREPEQQSEPEQTEPESVPQAQQYEVTCPACGNTFIISREEYENGFVYCGFCGNNLTFQ